MTDDLVQRLRKIATQTDDSTATEAADRIEALEAALRKIIEYETSNNPLPATWDVAKHALDGNP